jgi:putative phosphoesterase
VVRLAIVSDTHLPRGSRAIPPRCVELMRGADAILHAGDFAELEVLRSLRAIGPPVYGVTGNVDAPELYVELPSARVVKADGVRIAMLHDAGPADGRLERMRRRFPHADAVVFGHSHLPLLEERDGFAIFNPGSPTERRRAPRHTMGLATVQDEAVRFELVALD